MKYMASACEMFFASLASIFFSVVIYAIFTISKTAEIDYRLETGSLAKRLANVTYIDRSDIVEEMRTDFCSDNTSKLFGVVLGPSGTGKSHLARLTCKLYPHGCLYYEMLSPSRFPAELAKIIDMRLKEDAHIIHVLIHLTGIGDDFTFYKLPENLSDAVTYVLQILAERADIFQQKHHHMPCLFIDGVDLLAKKYPEVFVQLVNHAKYFANTLMLRIVLVSSEGHVVPLIDSTSSKTRKAQVIEVLDISYEEALNHLNSMNVAKTLAQRLFNLTGGRFVHLDKAIQLNRKFNMTLSEDELFNDIKSALIQDFVRIEARAMFEHKKAVYVMGHIIAEDVITPDQLYASEDDESKIEVLNAIQGLVRANLLRYTAKGDITWHSQIVRYAITNNPTLYGIK